MEREEQRKADADADADFGGIFESTREFSSPFLLLGYLLVCVCNVLRMERKGGSDIGEM